MLVSNTSICNARYLLNKKKCFSALLNTHVCLLLIEIVNLRFISIAGSIFVIIIINHTTNSYLFNSYAF